MHLSGLSLLSAAFYPALCFYGLVFSGGLVIFASPFFEPLRTAPQWMRKASWGAGFLTTCMGVSTWLLVFRASHLSRIQANALHVGKMIAVGGALALMLLLYCSANYWGVYRAHKLARKQRTEQELPARA